MTIASGWTSRAPTTCARCSPGSAARARRCSATAFVAAGAGFLLAVLWFDLMCDVQARGPHGELPEPALSSIAAYYARVTTAARPMNRLVAAVMVLTLVAIVVEIARRDERAWVAWTSLALTLAAVGLAGSRTVPNAVRLGRRRPPPDIQAGLARAILRDHIVCLATIAAVMVLQLVESSR